MSRNDVLWYLVEGETEQKVIAARLDRVELKRPETERN